MKHKTLALLLFGAFATSAVSHAAILIDYNDGIANGIHEAEVAQGGFSAGSGTVLISAGTNAPWANWAGTTNNGTYGTNRVVYIQGGGSIRNLTSYVAQIGDMFTYEWTAANYTTSTGANWKVGLVYDNGGTTTWANEAGSFSTLTGATPGNSNGMKMGSYTFTVEAGSILVGKTVGFGIQSTGSQYIEVDNVSLSIVPEPSTYGLLGAGALASVAFVRRRKRA